MRQWFVHSLVTAALGLGVQSARAESVELIELKELSPSNTDKEYEAFLKRKQEKREGVAAEHRKMQEELQKKVQDLAAQRAKLLEKGSATVQIDEQTITVAEPGTSEEALGLKKPLRDPYEVSPDDFEIGQHERWSLNQSDLNISAPQYITAETVNGSTKTWFGFAFSITNSSEKNRRIAPLFTAVTNKGVFNQAVGGFIPERRIADSMGRPLGSSHTLADKELLAQREKPLEPQYILNGHKLDPESLQSSFSPMSTFEPGQTRWGTALWTNFSNEFTELTVLVHGLSNAHRYDEKLRRVLVLTYKRNDDEFHTHREMLKLTERKWAYTWMWDQSITVPAPQDAKQHQLRVETLKTPAGGEKLVWGFPYILTNSTAKTQKISFHTVGSALKISVDVGGAKIPLDVKVTDDGRSSIYKAQFLKAQGKESLRDRFALNKDLPLGSYTETQRREFSLDSGKATEEIFAVFDAADIDWDDVRLQAETSLSVKLEKKDVSSPVVRRLSSEEWTAVQDQVVKGLGAALDEAKSKKTVQAYFTVTAGLSSGTYRISRCYRQLGVVQEEWLKAWEEFDKAKVQ